MNSQTQHHKLISLAMCFFAFYAVTLTAQEKDTVGRYIWFDETIGETNSGVFKGIDYVEKYMVIGNQHKFFLQPNFLNGSITYEGQNYYELDVKYDVYADELLVRHPGIIGSPLVQLFKDRVSEFQIEGHQFENIIVDEASNPVVSGFVEVLLKKKNLSFYKKHKKSILKKSAEEVVYYQFKDRHEYYIGLNGSFYRAKNTKDIKSLFPDYRKQLNDLEIKYKALKKQSFESYLISILTDFDTLLAELKQDEL